MFTVTHLRDAFVAHARLLVRAGLREPTTLRWYEDMLRHLDAFADFPADALRLYHLASVELTNGFSRALKQMYRWAAEEELIPRDPFTKFKIKPCGKRERVLDRAEVCRLYRTCNRQFRRLLFVQLRTIARPGEIRQLTWGQIDWDARAVVLVKFKGKGKRKDQLKALAIGLSRVVVRLLRNLYRKSPDPSPAGRVFRNTDGEPWNYQAVRSAMRRARCKARLDGEGERVVCYTLRHTEATNAVRKGIDVKQLAEAMGHARSTTTERYVHLNTADVVGVIDRMNVRERPPAKGPPPAA